MDLKEIEKFKKLSNEWWDETGAAIGLHRMNELRIPAIIEHLRAVNIIAKCNSDKRPLQGVSILDVGCGCGILSEPLAKLGASVVGVDGVEDMIVIAKVHASQDSTLGNLSYIANAVEELDDDHTEKYDVVVVSEVLDHVVEKDNFVKACANCLRPGGALIASTISQTHLATTFAARVPEDILLFIPKGIHEYHMFITPEDTAKLLQKYNCSTTGVRGMYYNHFTSTWFWMTSNSVWYFIFAVKNQ